VGGSRWVTRMRGTSTRCRAGWGGDGFAAGRGFLPDVAMPRPPEVVFSAKWRCPSTRRWFSPRSGDAGQRGRGFLPELATPRPPEAVFSTKWRRWAAREGFSPRTGDAQEPRGGFLNEVATLGSAGGVFSPNWRRPGPQRRFSPRSGDAGQRGRGFLPELATPTGFSRFVGNATAPQRDEPADCEAFSVRGTEHRPSTHPIDAILARYPPNQRQNGQKTPPLAASPHR